MKPAHFKKYILLYTIIPLLILTIATAYFRFVIVQDYFVSYEGECDPITESCFVDCEDDECTEEYYYTMIERKAIEIFNLCGEDITDCAAANSCPVNGAVCSITYCEPEIDGDACEAITSSG